MQGLTTTQGQTLSAIIDKLDQGISLTENENTTGEALAQATLLAANNLTIQQMRNAYTGIPAGNTVIDPATGRIINPGTLTSSNGGQYQI